MPGHGSVPDCPAVAAAPQPLRPSLLTRCSADPAQRSPASRSVRASVWNAPARLWLSGLSRRHRAQGLPDGAGPAEPAGHVCDQSQAAPAAAEQPHQVIARHILTTRPPARATPSARSRPMPMIWSRTPGGVDAIHRLPAPPNRQCCRRCHQGGSTGSHWPCSASGLKPVEGIRWNKVRSSTAWSMTRSIWRHPAAWRIQARPQPR